MKNMKFYLKGKKTLKQKNIMLLFITFLNNTESKRLQKKKCKNTSGS